MKITRYICDECGREEQEDDADGWVMVGPRDLCPECLAAQPKPEPCDGFAWIGQSFRHCDDCGLPYWEHTHDKRTGAKLGEVRLVPITPEQAAACKAKWDPTHESSVLDPALSPENGE